MILSLTRFYLLLTLSSHILLQKRKVLDGFGEGDDAHNNNNNNIPKKKDYSKKSQTKDEEDAKLKEFLEVMKPR